MNSKSIFASKTLWLNILGPLFGYIGTKYGLALTPDQQLAVIGIGMAGANALMRLVTRQPVHVTAPPKAFVALVALGLAGMSVALGGCSALDAVAGNDQVDAGITHVHVDLVPIVDATGKTIAVQPSSVDWVDGKDKANITMAADVNKGTITYTAGGVTGAQAIALRSQVEQVVAQEACQAVGTGGVVNIVNQIMAAIAGGIPAAPGASNPCASPSSPAVPIVPQAAPATQAAPTTRATP